MTRIISAGLFVLAMLFFLLPWASTRWPDTYEVSGADLVLGRDVPYLDSRGGVMDLRYGVMHQMPPEPLAIAVLALAVAGAALSLSKGKRGCALRGLAGWLGVVLVILTGSNYPDIESGFLLTVSALGLAAILNAVVFNRLQGVGGVRKPWLAALLNLVPVVPGAGYLYLGRPRMFAFSLIGYTFIPLVAFGLWAFAVWGSEGGCFQGCSYFFALFFSIPVILYLALVAWDAWHLADESGPPTPIPPIFAHRPT
jgi:hypothetical protein